MFEEVDGFDESFVRNQDRELLTKILKKYKIAYSSEPGLIVHVHPYENVVDYEVTISNYLKNFKKGIDALSDSDRKKSIGISTRIDSSINCKTRKL